MPMPYMPKRMPNPGAKGYYYWTERNPKGHASEPVELVKPDGTLAGLTLKTLENGWGAYLDKDRNHIEQLIIARLNNKWIPDEDGEMACPCCGTHQVE